MVQKNLLTRGPSYEEAGVHRLLALSVSMAAHGVVELKRSEAAAESKLRTRQLQRAIRRAADSRQWNNIGC